MMVMRRRRKRLTLVVVEEEKVDEILAFFVLVRLHSSSLNHQRDPMDRIFLVVCWRSRRPRMRDHYLLHFVLGLAISP